MTLPASYHEIYPSPQPEFFQNSRGFWHLHSTMYAHCDAADLEQLWEHLYTEPGCYYPHPPSGNVAICRRARMMPRGKIGGTAALASYDEATVEIYYSTDGPVWVNNMYVQERIIPATWDIKPPKNHYWPDGVQVTAEEQQHVIRVNGLIYELHVGRSLTYPASPMGFIDTTNSALKIPYTFPNYRFGPGTVLYAPPLLSSESSYTSTTRYAYTFRYPVNPWTWNRFWNKRAQQWQPLYTNATTTTAYIPHPQLW